MGLTPGRRAEGGKVRRSGGRRLESRGRTLGGPRRAMAEGGGGRADGEKFLLRFSTAKYYGGTKFGCVAFFFNVGLWIWRSDPARSQL